MGDVMGNDLWLDGDPFDDPAWKEAALMADAPPRSGKNYGVYSLAYLARVLPVVRTPAQLAVAMLLYRKAVQLRRRTFQVSNEELKDFGISRYAKYRALARLTAAGAITIRTQNRQSIEV